jgi:hypothetical protein
MNYQRYSNPSKNRSPRIAITYETITEESAAEGDVADRGWIDEEGVEMEPDEDETLAEVTVKFLRDAGATEASSSFFHPGIWYTTYGEMSPRTGEDENRSYHLKDFTEDEERVVYEQLHR